MCCGATVPSSFSSANAGTAWSATSGGAADYYAVLPKGETTERVVASYAEAITATAAGGGMRSISAAEADRIKSLTGQTG